MSGGSGKKIALLGGTFDPVHFGHLEMARATAAEFGFDRVIMMPAGNPPHKTAGSVRQHRYNMCVIAAENLKFEVSDYELKKEGRSFSFETLEHFYRLLGEKPYFIVGADSMQELHTWRHPERIAAAARIVAVGRKGYDREEFLAACEDFRARYSAEVYVSEAEVSDISSTEVRLRRAFRQNLSDYVPEQVARYMDAHGLCLEYRPVADALALLMGRERWEHSMSTAIVAYKLAGRYGADRGKALRAALIHDCAKELDIADFPNEYGIEVPEYIWGLHPKVRHAPLGALYAEKFFGERDPEVLNAIRLHTSGAPEMTVLEKVIFIADYIDPLRGYEDTALMYETAFRDIDEAVKCKYAEIARKQ